MREYFEGETRESFAFMGFGAAALGAGLPLFVLHGDVGRPLSIPLMAVGLVELVLGIGLWVRTPAQVERLSAQLHDDPAGYQEAERKRMRAVMGGFQLYRAIELTLATTGVFMAGLGWVKGEPTVLGVGVGLGLQAVVLLALDHFAEGRGNRYAALLADFRP